MLSSFNFKKGYDDVIKGTSWQKGGQPKHSKMIRRHLGRHHQDLQPQRQRHKTKKRQRQKTMTLRQTSPWQPSPTTSTSKTNTKIKNKDKNKEKTKTKDNYFKTDITLAAITKTSSLANRCPMQDLSFTCSQTQDKKVENVFLVCHFNCQKKMETQKEYFYIFCVC